MSGSTFGKRLIDDYFKYLKQRNQQAPERALEIKEAVGVLEARGYALNEHKDVIRREFLGSVQRYMFGFYEDAVYHSCFAVEFAFLHLLEENLDAQRKMQIHDGMNKPLDEKIVKKNYVEGAIDRMIREKILTSAQKSEAANALVDEIDKQKISFRTETSFGFRHIIRECKRQALIDKTTYNLANKLNDVRDTHLHPQNFISALTLQYRDFLAMPEIVQRTFFRLVPGLKTVTTMPDYSWSAKDAIRKDVMRQVEEYTSDIREKINKRQVKELSRIIANDYYFKNRARQSIDLSFQILTKIGFY